MSSIWSGGNARLVAGDDAVATEEGHEPGDPRGYERRLASRPSGSPGRRGRPTSAGTPGEFGVAPHVGVHRQAAGYFRAARPASARAPSGPPSRSTRRRQAVSAASAADHLARHRPSHVRGRARNRTTVASARLVVGEPHPSRVLAVGRHRGPDRRARRHPRIWKMSRKSASTSTAPARARGRPLGPPVSTTPPRALPPRPAAAGRPRGGRPEPRPGRRAPEARRPGREQSGPERRRGGPSTRTASRDRDGCRAGSSPSRPSPMSPLPSEIAKVSPSISVSVPARREWQAPPGRGRPAPAAGGTDLARARPDVPAGLAARPAASRSPVRHRLGRDALRHPAPACCALDLVIAPHGAASSSGSARTKPV